MWLAKQQKRERAEAPGGVGEVTLGGNLPAVELESERRDLPVYAPGGYRWRPAQGQKVLVLKAEGEPCIVGALSETAAPGEIALESAGGASVRLDSQGTAALESAGGASVRLDSRGAVTLTGAGGASVRLDSPGTVTLAGSADVKGKLYIEGQELTEVIRSIAAEILSAMI